MQKPVRLSNLAGTSCYFAHYDSSSKTIGSQLARMNLTRLLIDIPDDRHWVVGGIIY